ncbi:hypothetical protein [Lacipirellula limnantheis]|uniref:hypothetical protein n=1 Tax=Lacipirellula limnantheis TaxID=2528024 RepID=UPI00119F0FB9|nr:hypothetical protein [Lacipirellula limnantheis]
MNSPLIHERRRIMAPAKKVDFCQLIHECHSLVAAAKWIDVSIRTVQRARRTVAKNAQRDTVRHDSK